MRERDRESKREREKMIAVLFCPVNIAKESTQSALTLVFFLFIFFVKLKRLEINDRIRKKEQTGCSLATQCK